MNYVYIILNTDIKKKKKGKNNNEQGLPDGYWGWDVPLFRWAILTAAVNYLVF